MRLDMSFAPGVIRGGPTAPAGPTVRGAPATGTGAPALPTHQTGDVLVVFTSFNSSPGNLTAAGWTRRSALSNPSTFLYAYSKPAASGAESITLGTTPDGYVAYAVQGGTDVDVAGNGTAGTDTNCIAPTVTPTGPALLLNGYCAAPGAGAVTVPNGQTASAQVGAVTGLRAGTESVAAGATGTRTATLAVAGNSIANSIAVK